jgi:predicted dehydrogenase
MIRFLFFLMAGIMLITSCNQKNTQDKSYGLNKNQQMDIIMTVDPGHFHAALVQKIAYDQISPDVYVYAPEGKDLQQHLALIKSYNDRPVNPTHWNEIVYTGKDFFQKMLKDKPGNIVILAGNNRKKAEYITESVRAGLNVLADKPMIILPEDFPELEEAFRIAREKGVLLYDIMTERYEVTTILQKELSHKKEIFGELIQGTENEPAVTKESVHHFSKIVSGTQLVRPAWYFDTDQQGEGIVDVTTHLVDLVQWECYPEQILNPRDVNMVDSKRWPTLISKEEFKAVTGVSDYPEFLHKDIKNGILNVFSNGEMTYQLKGTWVKISVEWRYKAPEGGGDTHYSVMHGTICDLVIKQTSDENFVPTLYIENVKGMSITDFASKLKNALATLPYDSLIVEKADDKTLRIDIPDKYRVGHEAHFGQVMAKFLGYLEGGKLPEWEVEGMITKYYTTTSALKLAKGE